MRHATNEQFKYEKEAASHRRYNLCHFLLWDCQRTTAIIKRRWYPKANHTAARNLDGVQKIERETIDCIAWNR